MTVLTQTIAQDIAERTMKILTHNINVMNESGLIIGSGDRHRIGMVHEGAVKVIENKKRIDIGVNPKELLAGTKPGVNLPIVFKENIVGVIGISGDPEEIAQFGELVKMTAEMMLEQSSLIAELEWDVRIREELVNQLIHHETDELSFEQAERLHIDLTKNRIPILLELIPTHMKESTLSQLKKKILSYLQTYLHENDLMANSGSTKIIILKSYEPMVENKHIAKEFQSLAKMFNDRYSVSCLVGIGMEYTTLSEAQTSYQYAKEALKVGKTLYPDDVVYDHEELLLPILLSQFSTRGNKLLDDYQKLVAYDKRGELQTTLHMYIEEDGELSQTAKKLYIHRNTLSYRLEKIEQITGKDPRKTKDLLRLHISHLLYQLK